MIKSNTTKMESKSIAQKQQYLRQKIMDAGYDADDFVEYCTSQHALSDLADWTMNKLIEVVRLYILSKTNQKNQPHQIDSREGNQDNQWSNFQAPPHQPNQFPTNQAKQQPNTTKSGSLVFSEADWGIFLGPGSIQTTSDNKGHVSEHQIKKTSADNNQKKAQLNKKDQTSKSPIILSNLPLQKLGLNQQNKFEALSKQNPLSPPSKNIKKQCSMIGSAVEQVNSNNQNRGPINFTNIKLQTAKVKQMPKLPQINDIVITKTELISRNFLQSDYTLYYIHFTPGNYTIQRKFTDLRKLRVILQNLYPHIRLPFLQSEGWLASTQGKDTQTLAKYKWMVVDFLKYIVLRNEQLKNSPVVRKFCGFSTSLKSQKQYDELSKQELKKTLEAYQNLPKPKNIGELCLLNSTLVLPPSNDGQKKLANTINLIQQIDHEYQRLRRKFDTLFYNYDVLAKSMADVSNSFENLENLVKKYNFDNDEPKEFRVYQGIRQICNKMHNTMNEHYLVFKTRIKNILRYERDNMMTLKELFDTKSKIHSEYAKQGYPILSKGSQSGGSQVQIESNISLQQPCKNNKNILCVQQIFWSHYVKEQIKSYWQQLRNKINQQLTMISYEELDNENDNLNFWNSMIKKCVV